MIAPAAELLRPLSLGSIPLAAVLGVLAMAQLYVVAALSGALTLVFGVAFAVRIGPGPTCLAYRPDGNGAAALAERR